MRVGEIGGALPSKIVLKERVGWFIALPHLSDHTGNPLVDALAEVCFLVAVRISSCSNTSRCCCSWFLLKLLFFPEQSLIPFSLLPYPLHCHRYNSGCRLSLHSKLSFVFCSSRSPAFFLFPCWFWALTTLSPAQTDSLRKAMGKIAVCSFLYAEKGFLPLMLHVTVRPQVWYFYLLGMPLFHLSTFFFSKREKRLNWISDNCSYSCWNSHNAVHLQVLDHLSLSSFFSLRP